MYDVLHSFINSFPNICFFYGVMSKLFNKFQFCHFSQHHLLKKLLFLHWLFLVPLLNISWLYHFLYFSLLVCRNLFLYIDLVCCNLVELSTSEAFFFLLNSLVFSAYRIMSSVNNDSFISSFPIWLPFSLNS